MSFSLPTAMDISDPIVLLTSIFCGLVVFLYLYGRVVRYLHNRSPPVNKMRLEEWLNTQEVPLPTEDAIIKELNSISDFTAVAIEGGVEWRQLRIERFLPDTSLPQFEIQSIKTITANKMVFTSVVRWPDCTPGLEVSVMLDKEKILCHMQVDWMLMFAKCTLIKTSEGGVELSWKQTSPPVTALSCMVIDPPHWKANIDISQPLLESPNAKESEGVASSVADGVLKLLKNFELSNFDLSSPHALVNGVEIRKQSIEEESSSSIDQEIPLESEGVEDSIADPRPDSHTMKSPDSHTSDNSSLSDSEVPDNLDSVTNKPDSHTTSSPQSHTSDAGTVESMNTGEHISDTDHRNGDITQHEDSIHDNDDHIPSTGINEENKDSMPKCNGNLSPNIEIKIITPSPPPPPRLSSSLGISDEELPTSPQQQEKPPSPLPRVATPPKITTPPLNDHVISTHQEVADEETTPISEATPIIESPKLDSIVTLDPVQEEKTTPSIIDIQKPIDQLNEPIKDNDTNSEDKSTPLSWKRSFHEELNDSLNSSSSTSQLRVLTYSDEDLTSPGKSPFNRNKTLSIRSYDTDSPMTDASGHFLTTVVFEVQDGGRKKHMVAMNPTHANRLRKQLGKYTKLHIYNDHTFIATHIKGKQVCGVCEEKISGLFGKQAYVCRDCNIHTHKMCHHKMETACIRSQVSTLNLIYPEKIPSYALS